jgi:hypothetical protein
VTERGTTMLVPRGTRTGDVAVFFAAGKVPCVLRPCQNTGRYEILGEGSISNICYRHGILFREYNKYLGGGYHHLQFVKWITAEEFVVI